MRPSFFNTTTSQILKKPTKSLFSTNLPALALNSNLKHYFTQRVYTLKNGTADVPESSINLTLINIINFYEKNPLAFYEFVQKCSNLRYEVNDDCKKLAESFALTQKGEIPDYVKNIVLSTVSFRDGGSIVLDPPIANADAPKIQILGAVEPEETSNTLKM